MRTLRTVIPIVVLFAMVAATPGFSQLPQDHRVALSELGYLAGADVTEAGLGLFAWRLADSGVSRVEVVEDGARTAAWDLPDLLVKGARWAEPGELLLLDAVAGDGAQTRLYAISGNEIRLEWSTRSLGEGYDSITVSPDGRFWLASRFGLDASEVAIGRVKETQPLWTWQLDGQSLGKATRAEVTNYSYAFFLEEPADVPDVGILWGARLWVARATSQHLVRIEPPNGCKSTQSATATRTGIWIHCSRGLEARNPNLWALYSDGFSAAAELDRPAVVERHFRAPEFLRDGTILDQRPWEGRSEVYGLTADGSRVERLGTLWLPPDARTIIAGGALLVEDGDATDEYRVSSLGKLVAELRSGS